MESLENSEVATNEEIKKNVKDENSLEELYSKIKDNPDLFNKIKEEIDNQRNAELEQMMESTESVDAPEGQEEAEAQDDTTEQDSTTEQDGTNEEQKGKHKNYRVSINHTALKELEGTTTSSFLALARAVILIDNRQYDNKSLTLSKERKNDFRRFIEHYAVVEVIGKRKYHIKRVYSKKQREELNELEIFPKCDKPKR